MHIYALKHHLELSTLGATGEVVPAPSWCIVLHSRDNTPSSPDSELPSVISDALRAAPLQQVHSTRDATSVTDFQILSVPVSTTLPAGRRTGTTARRTILTSWTNSNRVWIDSEPSSSPPTGYRPTGSADDLSCHLGFATRLLISSIVLRVD